MYTPSIHFMGLMQNSADQVRRCVQQSQLFSGRVFYQNSIRIDNITFNYRKIHITLK